jgi:hypothetical protein
MDLMTLLVCVKAEANMSDIAKQMRCCETQSTAGRGMTPDEWATLMYKHLDHHLRQFGVMRASPDSRRCRGTR